ncbi:mycofactocin precursor [Mycolicibacterium diernhoferi]|nr:mycofactocin precursor [Mycolicibacterium diernhoferi]
MPYSCEPGHKCREPDPLQPRKVRFMDQNQQVETEAQLVTESLVEEVSIDGMCGVY